jgi:2,3-dihydro-2,3-dihydroxybenzoate dehydrogenase
MQLTGLAGTTALVTGARGNIGREVVAQLGRAGVRVAAADRAPANGSPAAFPAGGDGAGPAPVPAMVLEFDLRDEDSVRRAVAAVEDELGPIGLLVHAAGISGEIAPLVDRTRQEYDEIFGANVLGTFLCVREVARRMAARRRGCVVAIGSNSVSVLRSGQTLYGASKAAAQYLVRCLGLELARHGVRCVTVNPGTMDLPMGGGERRLDRVAALVEGSPEEFRPGIPLGRLAAAGDVAHAVCFLASDQAAHITCADLTVDGGATLRPG